MSFFTIPSLIILASRPGGGKTTLIKFEFYKGAQKKSYDCAIIFTKNIDDKFEEVIKEDYIYYNYTDKNLAKILKYQNENPSNRLLLIFDDIIGSLDFNSPLITILVTRYRHFNIGLIFSTQYLFKIPPPIRECTSKASIFYQEMKKSMNACYETYGESMKSYKAFANYVTQNTEDHKFIVVNGKANNIASKFEIKKIDINSIPKNALIEF